MTDSHFSISGVTGELDTSNIRVRLHVLPGRQAEMIR